jgi:hypothetical protein
MDDFRDVLLLVAASIYAALLAKHYSPESGRIQGLTDDEADRLRAFAHQEARALHSWQP